MIPPEPRTRAAALGHDRRGTAIVEAAIVLPVMILLLFGLIEIGRALMEHHTLTRSVRDAARYVARVPLLCPATDDPTWSGVKSIARNLALTGQRTGGTPLVPSWTTAAFSVADPVCEDWSGRPVQVITVNASVPYQDLGFLTLLGLSGFTLGASNQQPHVGE